MRQRDGAPPAGLLEDGEVRVRERIVEEAGYDGAKRTKGSKVHMAVDTLGHLLSLHVTAADEQDREQVGRLAKAAQAETGKSVELAYVDQGYTGELPAEAAEAQRIELSVVKLPEANRGFVLLPRRWGVERSFAWVAWFRRLAKDYERLASTLKGMHVAASRSSCWPDWRIGAKVHNTL